MAKHIKKPWQFTSIVINGAAAVASGVGAAYALRRNNLEMLRLRQAVLTADGKQQDVPEALGRLQGFVTSHMNTELPRLGSQPSIQLKTTYEKLVQTEQTRISAARQTIASEATAYCEENVHGYLSNRAACVADYTAARQVVEVSVQADLYKYNFAAPSWSPDQAGILIVVTGVLAITFILQCLARIVARFFLADY